MTLGWILAGVATLLLPGAAWLIWLGPTSRDLASALADVVGVSMGLVALGGLMFFLLGVAPGAAGVAVFYGTSLAAFLAGLAARARPGWKKILSWRTVLSGGSTLAALLALVAYRLYQAHTLVFPNWVDSVHHSLVVRLILETGGLPATFQPYLDAPFSYHYGFHLITAVFALWSGLPPERAVLWFGQALLGLVSLALYRFGRALGMGWRSAGLAGLLTGFVLQLPAYYLTWGRYTLAAGLIMLLLAMAAALDAQAQPTRRRLGLQVALLTAGVCLTHTLATLLLLLFLVVLGLLGLLRAALRRPGSAIPWRLALWSGAGGLAALPWLVRTLDVYSAQVRLSGLVTTVRASDWAYLFSLLGPHYNHVLMALGGVGLLLALRKPGWLVFNVWSLLLVFLAQPYSPRLGPFRPDLFAIVLFIPAGLALAGVLADGAAALTRVARRDWLGGVSLGLASALLLAWGLRETRNVVNPATVIATRADLSALEWVRVNTPAEARFYINPAPWMGSVYRGVDGGYWLMPFTGRFSLVPPVFYSSQPAETVRQTNEWIAEAGKLTGCTPEFWRIVSQADLDYVYVRAGVGSLQPDGLDQCPRLTLAYRQGGVSIYAIERLP